MWKPPQVEHPLGQVVHMNWVPHRKVTEGYLLNIAWHTLFSQPLWLVDYPTHSQIHPAFLILPAKSVGNFFKSLKAVCWKEILSILININQGTDSAQLHLVGDWRITYTYVQGGRIGAHKKTLSGLERTQGQQDLKVASLHHSSMHTIEIAGSRHRKHGCAHTLGVKTKKKSWISWVAIKPDCISGQQNWRCFVHSLA